MLESPVSKETKLHVTKDLVSSAVVGAGKAGKVFTPQELKDYLTAVYEAVDGLVPDPERRRIGLGA